MQQLQKTFLFPQCIIQKPRIEPNLIEQFCQKTTFQVLSSLILDLLIQNVYFKHTLYEFMNLTFMILKHILPELMSTIRIR